MKKQVLRQSCHQRGYTLVETLTALLIASTGIAGLSFSVTNAVRTGTTANQSATVAIAHRSAFTHLRNYFNSLNTIPDSYRFQTDTINVASGLTQPESEISDLVTTLERSLGDLRSIVDCQSRDSFICEVCFEWYEHVQTYRSQNVESSSQAAINRSVCQLQIV